MSIHSKALKKACDNLNLAFREIGDSGVFLAVKIGKKEYHFIANRVPLNNSIVPAITEDKGHCYDLLHQEMPMPRTLSFLDPDVRELYQLFVKENTLDEIIARCEQVFQYPFIVKKNSGSQGTNVFKCEDNAEVKQALEQIFNHKSIEYDHIALVQEYVPIKSELRVTVLNKKIELIYEKDISQASFNGNLSPLHRDGAKAILVTNEADKKKLARFIEPIYSFLDLEYGGIDIAIDKNYKHWLLEINSHPAYDHLVSHTSENVLIELYEKMLRHLENKE